MGRPAIEVTEDHIRQISTLAGHGLTQEQIADLFGWSEATLRRRLMDDAAFLNAYKKGRADAINAVASGLYQRATSGDNTAAIFYLKTQAQWREVSRTELTGKDGEPIKQETVEPEQAFDRLLDELDRLAARRQTSSRKSNGRTAKGA